MTIVAISQSNYLPWKGYFQLISSADIFVFYDTVDFTKRDWRSRNKIIGPKGFQWMTIPVDQTVENPLMKCNYLWENGATTI